MDPFHLPVDDAVEPPGFPIGFAKSPGEVLAEFVDFLVHRISGESGQFYVASLTNLILVRGMLPIVF